MTDVIMSARPGFQAMKRQIRATLSGRSALSDPENELRIKLPFILERHGRIWKK